MPSKQLSNDSGKNNKHGNVLMYIRNHKIFENFDKNNSGWSNTYFGLFRKNTFADSEKVY